jgi:tetratricopeptide (TPR) repeat protein
MRGRALALALLCACAAPGCYDPHPADPPYVPKIFAQEENNHAAAALRAGDLDRALAHAQVAVDHDPRFVAARVNLAHAQARLGRFADAAATLEGGEPEDPAIAQAHLFRGIYLEQAGDTAGAQAAFATAVAAYDAATQARRAKPEDEVHRAIATYLGRGQTQGLRAINEVAARYPALHSVNFARDRMLDNDRAYFVRWLSDAPGADAAPDLPQSQEAG